MGTKSSIMFVKDILLSCKRYLIIFITPIALLPLLTSGTKETSCAFCLLLMTIYWITEVIPLSVTGLLPVVLLPAFHILTANEVAEVYIKNPTWLLIGGCTIAVAIEKTMLHKRIALKILLLLGTTPPRLMLGFMLPTYFLSMWISNTAAGAMMMPILQGVFTQMDECDRKTIKDEESTAIKLNSETPEDSNQLKKNGKGANEIVSNIPEPISRKKKTFDLGMTLCVPYAASIGGISTLTGSTTNIVLAGLYQDIFPSNTLPISFGSWFIYNIPISFTMLLLGYIYMACYFIGWRELLRTFSDCKCTQNEDAVRRVLVNEHMKLGDMRWSEGASLVVFTVMAILWVFRSPGFMPGWGAMVGIEYIQDGTVAIAASIILFVIPEKRPRIFGGERVRNNDRAVLTWSDAQEKVPWGIMFLLGGGFALAKGSSASKLTALMGSYLKELGVLPAWLICLFVTIASSAFTECTSNVAAASILVPIISQLAVAVRLHPLYVLLPSVEAASLAFMLPVATPCNAIAFQTGRIKVLDMVKAGSVMNIIGIATVFVFINTYGMAAFGLNTFPEWAADDVSVFNDTNVTIPS